MKKDNKPECYSCKSKITVFGDHLECGELCKEGRHLLVDWWYWNGYREPCPETCPLLRKGEET